MSERGSAAVAAKSRLPMICTRKLADGAAVGVHDVDRIGHAGADSERDLAAIRAKRRIKPSRGYLMLPGAVGVHDGNAIAGTLRDNERNSATRRGRGRSGRNDCWRATAGL